MIPMYELLETVNSLLRIVPEATVPFYICLCADEAHLASSLSVLFGLNNDRSGCD